MTSAASDKDDTERMAAHRRNKLVLDQARAAGLLGIANDVLVSARLPASLVAAAKHRAHIASDTELLKIALSRLALEDDFGPKLVRRKGGIPRGLGLDF
ncbi:hypothetical protein SAMN05519103_04317 [Rhizobiales bacterium GAS113]|jgi:hypothetical protein|nr:hypothetical protein SAMN05519103_04317 [Rhizobiales bacterium GAS113]